MHCHGQYLYTNLETEIKNLRFKIISNPIKNHPALTWRLHACLDIVWMICVKILRMTGFD